MTLHLSVLDQSPIICGRTPARAVIGDRPRARERLPQLREPFEADEPMILTITGDCASRLRSYELLAREFALK